MCLARRRNTTSNAGFTETVHMSTQQDRQTKIHVVFTSSGINGTGSSVNYRSYRPTEKVLSNEEILSDLKNRCDGVDFLGTSGPIKGEEATRKVKKDRAKLDGVLYFGTPLDSMVSLGLPIVAVHPWWGQWQEGFHPFTGMKVVTSFLPVIPDVNRSLFQSRLDDIASKIKIIRAVSRMDGLKVLVVTDRPVLGAFEPSPSQFDSTREEYEQTFLRNMKNTFRTEFVNISEDDRIKAMKKTGDEAQAVAEKWIAECEAIKGTNDREILKSARLYLALKQLMLDHGCSAVATEDYGVPTCDEDGFMPSQGLPSSQFCTDGVVATSETLMDSLLTQQVGLFITGSTGTNGDYIIDPPSGTAILGHCEGLFNPYGDGKRVPYVIRNRPQVAFNTGGACVQVKLPADETVTVAKLSMYRRKLSIFTGRTVSGDTLFPGWDDLLCRNKLAIKTDAQRLFDNVDWKTFGWHKVVFYGDHRQQFKNLAKLIGFEAIEKDRAGVNAGIESGK